MLRSFIHAAKVPVGKSRLVTWIVSNVVAVRLASTWAMPTRASHEKLLFYDDRNTGQKKKRRRKKLIIAIVVECVVEGTTTSSAIVGSLALCECMESNMINIAPRPLPSYLCETIWIAWLFFRHNFSSTSHDVLGFASGLRTYSFLSFLQWLAKDKLLHILRAFVTFHHVRFYDYNLRLPRTYETVENRHPLLLSTMTTSKTF